ncbi:MAG: DUF2520 domain-containing protein [Cyclobacteriaceae bacterium]|jgi:predicted short-subunit dehydrogenase-like oxidoreductase (DUF2520 family)|nr:DUF2520 domain-containing protein [Cyclobacteriaceae bacterium]
MKARVSIIGSGNLAWHLAPALDNAGFSVREVYSRHPAHAEALVERLYEASVKATLDFSTSESFVFIVAVTDDAIADVAREIILPENGLLVHTSGSQPLSTLGYAAAASTGVFYPLQTFSKSRAVDFADIPVFVESESAESEALLLGMGRAISKRVHAVDSDARKAIHLSAVFAANFTNHMITIAQDLAMKHQLNFDWFVPLIAETINKALSMGPREAQTGPARRGDFEILDKHMDMLQEDVRLAELYRVISQHIIDTLPDN